MLSQVINGLRGTTLRTRLTIWNAAVVLLITAVTLLAVRFAARRAIYADADLEFRAASQEIALAVRELDPDESAVVAEMRRKAQSHEERGWFMQLLTEQGRTIWQSDHCPASVAAFPPAYLDREENIVQVGPYRYVRLRIERPGRPAYHVRVGMFTALLEENLARLLRILLTIGLALSMLAPLAAFWLAGRATRPLADILHTAERLRPTRLGDRLPIRGNSDELDRLAKTINGLLDSVASHVDQQEQFVTDAAHELRGPLAALQSSLEVAVSQDQAPADRQELLTDMLEAARHLSKVANDLLILAEAGSAARPATHGPVDVGAISRQAVAMFAGVAEECGLALSLDATGSALAAGDPVDLRRLLSNLLDNAIRFTRPGGRVAVKLVDAPASSGLILTVSDTGTGIAPRDLDHVFDRFFKADPARSHGGSGRSGGLGLAICRSIVESSGGTIGIASRLGEGTTVTVRLPSTPLSDLAQPLRAARVVLANATDRHR